MRAVLRGNGFSVRFARLPAKSKPSAQVPPKNAAPDTPPPNKLEPEDYIRFWEAAKRGDCATLRVLVMAGISLDARDGEGRTALNIAMQYDQKGAIKTLLAAKNMRALAERGLLPQTQFYNKFRVKI